MLLVASLDDAAPFGKAVAVAVAVAVEEDGVVEDRSNLFLRRGARLLKVERKEGAVVE